jgi:hypothetical protein
MEVGMIIGDLVYEAATGRYGIVERIDADYHGARQAFKHVGRPRGQCVDSTVADVLATTRRGICDRVMVCWTDGSPEYLESHELEVVSEK